MSENLRPSFPISASPYETVLPPCPACDVAAARQVLSWDGGMEVHGCCMCGLLFAHPLPSSEELDRFYQGFLYRKPDRHKLVQLIDERKRELVALFGLQREPQTSNVRTFLDHGGGTGLAYAAANQLGCESWFAEMDRQAIAYVSEQFGLTPSRLAADLSAHASSFDYILSDNVIEHVPDPVELIRSLFAALRPGGVLIVKTPNASATDMYFYPRVWWRYMKKVVRANGWKRACSMLTDCPVWCCDPPRHLYSFSASALERMAKRAGIDGNCLRLETYDVPLLKNTFVERFMAPRPGTLGRLRQAALLPMVPLELAAKLVQVQLRRTGGVSPGGLILRVTRQQL